MTDRGLGPATRQRLLMMRRRLGQVGHGIGLLRRKREALVGELFRQARPAAAQRRTIEERAEQAWPVLLEALAAEGSAGLRSLGWPSRDIQAELRAARVWGIPVAELRRQTPVRRTLAARGTPPGAASAPAIRAGTAFEDLTDALLEAAEREALIRRLGEALARTSRQVNTLERRIGPELRHGIGVIRRTLDEREREDHVRLERRRERLAGNQVGS
jgi:V/A-type H+-transporting ATPase subunit D